MLSSLAMVRCKPSTPIHLPTQLSVGGVCGTRVACTEGGAGLAGALDSWLHAASRARADRRKTVFFIAARPWLKSVQRRGERAALDSIAVIKCAVRTVFGYALGAD